MSLLEILVAVSGLGIGYWLVSVFLSNSPSASPIDPAQDHEPHEVDIGARPWTEVLGVDADADEAAITAAYRRRIAEYRPDRVATMAEEIRALASERTAELDTAYAHALRQLDTPTRRD